MKRNFLSATAVRGTRATTKKLQALRAIAFPERGYGLLGILKRLGIGRARSSQSLESNKRPLYFFDNQKPHSPTTSTFVPSRSHLLPFPLESIPSASLIDRTPPNIMTEEPPKKRKCLGADCENEASSLQCPKCLALGIKESYFCSQECFKKNWVNCFMARSLWASAANS
jgi:hypothetical protein